jgi:branched-chain amino acid transport system ATP-binding protein
MSFDGVEALSRLNFDVEAGEIFGIAGPNGAGKTTLFNVISGLYSGSGMVIFKAEDISTAKPHRICHLGIARTLQIPKIFTTLNVYDNIRFGAHFGKSGRKDETGLIQDALDFVRLKERKTEIAEHLGLFQKKLIMIAAALATQPELLLLDEPVGGLSPIEIKPLIGLIRRINRDLGITIIIIEHLMKVLKELSDRLMIIHYGKKICIGTSEHVMQDPKVKEIYLG